MNPPGLLDRFAASHGVYLEIAGELGRRLGDLLARPELKIHSFHCRVKTLESLRAKVARPERTYRDLDEITDLIGVRIITYFEDQVEEVGRLLEEHLAMDLHHSIDKRTPDHPTQFGYRSLHYVCRLPEELRREGAPPLFEIQIRTILQHAWAEIEHDLGYKTPVAIPEGIRRKLSRIAGLLEIADEEFVEIRSFLSSYQNDLQKRLASTEQRLPIDGVSLECYVQRATPTALDTRIAELLGKELCSDLFFPDYLIRMLDHVGLRTIDELDAALEKRGEEILASVVPYFQFTRDMWHFSEGNLDRCPRGYCLLFLAHLLVLQSSTLEISRVEAATRFFMDLDDPPDEGAARAAAERLVDTFRRHRLVSGQPAKVAGRY